MFYPPYNDNDGLAGTTWESTEERGNTHTEWKLEFEKENYHLFFKSYENNDGITAGGTSCIEEYYGPYSILENTIILSVLEKSTTGTINGNTMYFPEIIEEHGIILHKK